MATLLRKFSIELEDQIFATVALNDLQEATDTTYWVQAWKWGEWDHPKYGEEKINQEFATQLIDHFKANTYGQDLPFDFEHGQDGAKGLQAAAWVRDMEIRADGVYYLLEFTADTLDEIRAGKWRYISPAYAPQWSNDTDGTVYTNVPTGGAITNRPYFKGMLPLNFSELVITKEEKDEILKEFAAVTPRLPEETEGGTMDDVAFRKFCEVLGISLPEVFTEEDAMAKATELNDVVKPLREAKDRADNQRSFRESFPKEYETMIELQAAKVSTDAREFASNYERFTVKGADDSTPDTKDSRGFSALVLEKIENAHKEFSGGNATPDTLKIVLDHIASGGIVDYKEYGSGRQEDHTFTPADMNDITSVRKAFSELVSTFMTDDNMDYSKAVTLAAQKEPELFSAYQSKMPNS